MMPFQAVVGGTQALMRVVGVACFLVHTAFVQKDGVLLVPALECRFKRRLSALHQGQRQGTQHLCCRAFGLPGQVAHDDFDLVKLAHLHRYIQERTQQAAFAIADNALYHNASFLQRCDLLSVALNRLVLDFEHRQRPLADRVIQHHYASFSAEIGGEVHGCLWQRAFGLCSGFEEVATDRFDAASVLRGKLYGALLAFAVALPKGVGI